MQNWVAVLLMVGSLLFLAAAFSPISGRVFVPGISAQEQIAAVERSRTQWLISSALFGAGSVVAVSGMLLFAGLISTSGTDSLVRLSAYGAALIAAIGTVFWVFIIYYRIAHTAEQLFIGGSLSGDWLFPAYTVLTQLSLLVIGYVLLQAGYPGWLGWGMLAMVGLTVVGMAIFRDMPPFVHYIWILIMGLTLLWTAVPQSASAASSVPH